MDNKGYDYHVAIITVSEKEDIGLKANYKDLQELRFEDDEQVYYTTGFMHNGSRCRVVMARQNEMGMTAGAVLSMKLISRFRPRYLIMAGVAAGVAKPDIAEQIYGDVVVGSMIWNYSMGKIVAQNDSDIHIDAMGFIPDPVSIDLDETLVPFINNAISSDRNECHVLLAPIACGTHILVNKEIVEQQIYSQYSSTAAVDMESYAVAYAAKNAPDPRPKAVVIKSVCDFGDEHRDDKYQLFAAHTSAEFAKLLYEEFLPF